MISVRRLAQTGLALLLLLGTLLPAVPAAAQSGMVGQTLDVCVLRDTGGMDPAALIRHPERFDCTTPQYKLGPGDYWVISQDIVQRSWANHFVRIASVWQKRLSVYFLYTDGGVASVKMTQPGISEHIQLGAIIENMVPRRGAKLTRAMWHVQGAGNVRGIVLGARLATARESYRANLTMAAIYAGFGGLCLGLLVYNFALWGALRYRFQLWYCAMNAGLLGYAFSSSGALAWAWPAIANNDRLRINYVTLGLLAASALMFARSFFEEKVFEGWLGKLATTVSLMMAGAGLFVFCAAPVAIHFADTIFTCIFIGLALVVVPTLVRAWQLRSNFLWLFAIAWGAPILTAVFRILGNFHIVAWNFWLDNSTVLSMAAEALLSSLAIAYRIKLLSIERDEAMAKEEIARRLADIDPLTGLLNRRAFLDRAIGRPGEQLLQIADLDHFKQVNETLGHDGGDEVLRVFARILRTALPQGTLVARMGGEEFAILSDREAAIEPELLLARLRGTRMPFDARVTASIGSCTGPILTERDWKALYRGADAALFDAKSAGRDRARVRVVKEAA